MLRRIILTRSAFIEAHLKKKSYKKKGLRGLAAASACACRVA